MTESWRCGRVLKNGLQSVGLYQSAPILTVWWTHGTRIGVAGSRPAYGTNLRQFVDGFAYGSGCTLAITVLRCGNLHHLYEVLFRALGEVVRQAMGIPTSECLPGDSSGIAGAVEYTLEKDTGASSVQV